MDICRRRFLIGASVTLIAAPAIVHAANIMPVRSVAHLLAPWQGTMGDFAWREVPFRLTGGTWATDGYGKLQYHPEAGGVEMKHRSELAPEVWRDLIRSSTDYDAAGAPRSDYVNDYRDRDRVVRSTPVIDRHVSAAEAFPGIFT